MQIDLPEQTIRDIQAVLANQGDPVSVATYVDRTLQRALFFDTTREIKRQNEGTDPTEIDRLIQEACDATRQH